MITQCVNSIAEQFNFLRDQHVKQFLLLGLEDAGKTTLLYRLKIPQWKKNEITRELQHIKSEESDPSYHYEEFAGKRDTFPAYGIWDVPGNKDMIRLWPMFYKYIRITAVLFVVDATPPERGADGAAIIAKKIEQIDEARRQIHFLLNEDELRRAAFILILNTKKQSDDTKVKKELSDREYESALVDMLEVKSLQHDPPYAERFSYFIMDCAEASPGGSTPGGQKWTEILKRIRIVHDQVGEGAVVE
eukprot:CAMPEP_0178436964 /NCGR_PEP_ID=MMETSP0689_2-20121128/34718_1 /TAXON_ID=160604 /ORGANISM="Amphidinium massartii, Strain CS-259" /LENGTH=246 /DNA_ID=CAMNT_0020059091 /DNA_START=36 /DNA_END=773 /DNA_ORIENTATION=+